MRLGARALALLAAGLAGSFALGAAIDRAKEEEKVAPRRNFWAFQRPAAAPVPSNPSPWIRTPIDAFLLEGLTEKGLTPAPPLDSERLLRRVYLDVTGLPPTPEEARAFLEDSAPGAYERLIERVLASPHYGERWALKWLDVVRYADTDGFEADAERPHAWRYRDYVIASFNANKPYDRFLKEQIAGDEIWPDSSEALIATGFHRAGPIHLVGGNQDEEMNRQEVLTEMTNGLGAAFLGLTVGCARCHDHKFDPILQSDYYRLQAALAATSLADVRIASDPEQQAFYEARKAWGARIDPIKAELKKLEAPYRERVTERKKAQLEPVFRRALEVPEAQRTEEQKRLAKEARSQISPSWDEVVALIEGADRERRTELRRRMHALELEEPLPPPTAFAAGVMREAPVTHVLKVGDHRHKLDPVEPGFPTVLPSLGVAMPESPAGRRKALAEWLASPEHPLTARVMVNRIWQLRMGRGLVATPNDFGLLGERPSNQKLLDWLAVRFIELGWNVKAIDRMILLSNAYRQAAEDDPAKRAIDPDNKLWWRMNKRRLEGELIRDAVIAAAGSLNAKMGGPPVRIPIEPEIYDLIFTEAEPDNLWPVHPDPAEHRRRGIYLLNKRTVRLPMLASFDQPDAMTSCAVRPASTHALQALTLLNSGFMAGQAATFAGGLESVCGADAACQVRQAYRSALAREPRPEETAMARAFFAGQGRLSDFCLALLNRNEFVYIP